MRLTRIFALAAVALLVLGTSQTAIAQTSGAVVGTIADAQGATVPGANITLISRKPRHQPGHAVDRDGRLHVPERAA